MLAYRIFGGQKHKAVTLLVFVFRCCDRISVLTLQAYDCLSIGFEISASFSVLFDSNIKNMIEIIRRYLKQLRLPCGVTGLIIILL